jgi:hypothetical protein
MEQAGDEIVRHLATAAVAQDDLLVVAQRHGADGAFQGDGRR